jgi:protein-L-isoaspartate(D-aspartate) O-methyltransferase (PCMT)
MVERRFPTEFASLRTGTLGLHSGIVSEPEDLVRIIADEGVRDPRLLEALRSVPRTGFVPANLAKQAYEDNPLPIPPRPGDDPAVARSEDGRGSGTRGLGAGAGDRRWLRLVDGTARPSLRLRMGGGALRRRG